MTKSFIITSDSTSEMPQSYFDQHNISCLYLPCTIDGTIYTQENELSPHELFTRTQCASEFSTSQFNPKNVIAVWEPLLRNGHDILHISVSSVLSGSYNSCHIAAEELRERYPQQQIIIIDTFCTSLAEGLLLDYAVQMQTQGKTIAEIASWIEGHKHNFCLLVAVNDLTYFNRGGRVTDNMTNIKPLVHITPDGRLDVVNKVRGRKRSISTLIDMMEERVKHYQGEKKKFLVAHGDCEDEARQVAEQVQERLGYEEYVFFPMRMTNCIHSGPETIALGFMGTFR